MLQAIQVQLPEQLMLLIQQFLCLHLLQLLLLMKVQLIGTSYSNRFTSSIILQFQDTTELTITTSGVLSFISPADYEGVKDDPVNLPYDGSTYDITATVTATDVSSNAATQVITVSY